MPRKATGTVVYVEPDPPKGIAGHYRARITLSDGGRPWIDLDPGPRSPQAEKRAREKAAHWTERARREGRTRDDFGIMFRAPEPAKMGETVSAWYGRYYEAAARGEVGRKNRGNPQSAVDDRRATFRRWIEPVIGHLPMTGEGRADVTAIRRVVAKLDEQVRLRQAFYRGEHERDEKSGKKPGLSPKTAAHVWSECTSGFREACASKIECLRVRDDDPTRGVQPPDGGADREQAALYSSELLALLSCQKLPVARRRVYAVAAYTGLRRSELARVVVGDVDLDHGFIRVRGTKTQAAKRRVPIEPALRPLLVVLVRERKAEAARAEKDAASAVLLDVPRADGKGGAADLVRADLRRADLTREDLWLDTDVHMPFTFHGLRHTAITHWYLAGREATWLLIVAGHTMTEMTRRYLDAAAVARTSFGTPHPPLPGSLMGTTEDTNTEITIASTADAVPPPPVPGPESSQRIVWRSQRHKSREPKFLEPGLNSHVALSDPSGNRTRVTGVRGRCPNR